DISWQQWISSFGICLIAVSFTYGGYQQTINFGNDVKEPSKNIPKAIFIGIAVIILLYVNGSLLSNPRVMYAMSEDGVLPAFLKKKSEKKEVLVTSLTVFSAICIIVLFFADTFEKILSFSIFLD